MTPSADLILQYEVAPDKFRCIEFNGVPAARQSWICLASTGSATSLHYVSELKDAIESDLLQSGPVESKEVSCSVHPSAFEPKTDPDRRKVLFLIPSEDAPLKDVSWYANWNSDESLSHLMIAVQTGKYSLMLDPALQDQKMSEHPLRAVNATYWKERISEAVTDIEKRAEVTSPASRVFISYRRTDTLNLALQLFDKLSHNGFDVFLDRYSIPSGYNFQRRLNQELLDKSMVVLLESRNIQDSEWTRHEINFTVRNRLGLLTVPMPDVDPKTYQASANRKPLDASEFVDGEADKSGAWGQLTPGAVSELVAEVKRVHAEALFKRRERLRSEIVSALLSKGVRLPYSAVGPFRINQRSIDHIICTTTRPPEVNDFHDLYSSCNRPPSSSAQGGIVGPCATFEPDRKKRLQWLEKVTGCESFDEGKLYELANWLLTGKRA